MSLDSVEKLFRKKREDFWRKCIEHVKKVEENYWESDRIQDNKVEQLIIKLKPTDSSSSEMEASQKVVILQILISLNVNHVFGLSIYFVRVKRYIQLFQQATINDHKCVFLQYISFYGFMKSPDFDGTVPY